MKKEGLTWISRRTSEYRYSVNGTDQWVHPLSVYTAGEKIQRGQIVSIATALDLNSQNVTRVVDSSIPNGNNVVVKTRTDRHAMASGIALETAEVGEPVHLLENGHFEYEVNLTDEYNPGFTDDDRGKVVYAGPVPGELTLDEKQAVLGSRNLIQVGVISYTDQTLPDDGILAIELQFERDGRGPLETTQFEIAFGEPFSYTEENGNLTPRVFSLGQDDAQPFSYQFTIPRPSAPLPPDGGLPLNLWFAIYSTWAAHVFIFGPASTPHASTIQDEDNIQYLLQQSEQNFAHPLYTTNVPPASWGDPYNTQVPLLNQGAGQEYFLNTLFNAINSADTTNLFGVGQNVELATGIRSIETDGSGTQTRVNGAIYGTASGGPIFVTWDSGLDYLFNETAYEDLGTYQNAGRAVLADRRFQQRARTPLGLLLQDEQKDFEAGDLALFIRKGTYVAPESNTFTPGENYYMGTEGRLTPFNEAFQFPESIVYVGTAKTTRRLMVDIHQPTTSRVAGMPIGGIKPTPEGVNAPEYGFLLADGTTQHLSADYPQLLQELEARYDPADIYVDTSQNTFRIPELKSSLLSNMYYQIKATEYGYEPYSSSSIMKRERGHIASHQVAPIDVSELTLVGPQGAFENLTVDRIFPRLFVEVPTLGWREIPSGFTNAPNGNTYGFAWAIQHQSGQSEYTLWMDTGSGEGLYYLGDMNNPVSLEGARYRLLIMKPHQFARYSDFDLDIQALSLSTIDPVDRHPVNSEAVASYIDAQVDTQSLTVHNNTTLGDGHPGDDDTVVVNADMVVNDNTSSGGVSTIEVHSESGLIETTAPMSPLGGATNTATSTSLVTKNYVDDHRQEQITASYEVHGIRQGHTNGFNADLIDGLHASATAGAGMVPAIDSNGDLHLRKEIVLHRQENGNATSFIETASPVQINLFGTSNAAFLLGLGSGNNRRYIGNNSGTLEILENNILGESYGTIKAGQYKTASSRSLKANIEDFDSALDIVKNVRVVSYTYIDQTEPQVGFIAEDTDPLLSGSEQDAMNIPSTVGVLLRAVQELSQQNEELQDRVRTLERQLSGDMK